VQFTGGADVSPFLYGQGRHEKTTNINPQRDERETVMYGVALSTDRSQWLASVEGHNSSTSCAEALAMAALQRSYDLQALIRCNG
jgi:hypothetical protein